MRNPQVPQNRNEGGTSLPHDGQRRIPGEAAGWANPGENPGTPGGGPIGCCIAGGNPGAPSGPDGGIPTIPAPPGVPRGKGCGIGCEGARIGLPIPPSGALATGDDPASAIIVFIMAMSPPGFGAAVSSAPQPRQNL
jgi:hypothetical protein